MIVSQQMLQTFQVYQHNTYMQIKNFFRQLQRRGRCYIINSMFVHVTIYGITKVGISNEFHTRSVIMLKPRSCCAKKAPKEYMQNIYFVYVNIRTNRLCTYSIICFLHYLEIASYRFYIIFDAVLKNNDLILLLTYVKAVIFGTTHLAVVWIYAKIFSL